MSGEEAKAAAAKKFHDVAEAYEVCWVLCARLFVSSSDDSLVLLLETIAQDLLSGGCLSSCQEKGSIQNGCAYPLSMIQIDKECSDMHRRTFLCKRMRSLLCTESAFRNAPRAMWVPTCCAPISDTLERFESKSGNTQGLRFYSVMPTRIETIIACADSVGRPETDEL